MLLWLVLPLREFHPVLLPLNVSPSGVSIIIPGEVTFKVAVYPTVVKVNTLVYFVVDDWTPFYSTNVIE